MAFSFVGTGLEQPDHIGISEAELKILTTDDARWKNVADQFSAVNLRLISQDAAVEENTKLTRELAESMKQLATSTSQMLDIFNAGQGFIRTLRVVGSVAKWVGYILTPIGVIWAIKTGKMPG